MTVLSSRGGLPSRIVGTVFTVAISVSFVEHDGGNWCGSPRLCGILPCGSGGVETGPASSVVVAAARRGGWWSWDWRSDVTVACLYWCSYRERGSSHCVAFLLLHGVGLGGRHVLPGLSGHINVVSLYSRSLLYGNSLCRHGGHWNSGGVWNLSGPELLRCCCGCAASARWLGYGSGSAVAGLSLLLAAA